MPLLAQYLELAARYHAYWPPPQACRPSAFPEAPVQALQRSLAMIRAWAEEAEPVIRALQRGESERGELLLWRRVLAAWSSQHLDPRQLAAAGPLLQVRLFVLPAGADAAAALPQASPGLETLACTLEIDSAAHLFVAGTPEAVQALAQRGAAEGPYPRRAGVAANAGQRQRRHRAATPGRARARARPRTRPAWPRSRAARTARARSATPTGCSG